MVSGLTSKSPFAIAYGKAYIGLGGFAKDLRHECCSRKDGGGTLAQAKFASNNMVNRLTGKSPFAIVYGRVSRHILDLAFLPKLPGMSVIVEKMADRINAVHIDMNKQLEESNAKYEGDADKHRSLKTFQGGDLVMVYLRKECFPVGTYNKLKNKKFGPFQIL